MSTATARIAIAGIALGVFGLGVGIGGEFRSEKAKEVLPEECVTALDAADEMRRINDEQFYALIDVMKAMKAGSPTYSDAYTVPANKAQESSKALIPATALYSSAAAMCRESE